MSDEEEAVRRMLAEARVDEPMPDAVRARLEDVLAELATTPPVAPVSASVTSLAARRRRRAGALLAAAAAVTVVGLAGPRLVGWGGGSISAESADSATAEDTLRDDSAGEGSFLTDEPAPAAEDQTDAGAESAPDDSGAATAPTPLPRLTTRNFSVDAEALRDELVAGTRGLSTDRECVTNLSRRLADRPALDVQYAGRRAALVLGKVTDGKQRVFVVVCGEGATRRSALLDAR